MEKSYLLEKETWTGADFENMNWHDNPIHGFCFDKNYKFYLDIDYIFKWVKTKNGKHFKFWISPCTLIFENVFDFVMEENDPSNFIILDIQRTNPKRPKNAECIKKEIEYDWVMETLQGEISFTSVGYTQYVRCDPKLINKQVLELSERGGISFNALKS